jgi:hypothetical protein
MLSIVGAGMGALLGLIFDFLGAGPKALIAGGVIGAIIPQLVLGSPGK